MTASFQPAGLAVALDDLVTTARLELSGALTRLQTQLGSPISIEQLVAAAGSKVVAQRAQGLFPAARNTQPVPGFEGPEAALAGLRWRANDPTDPRRVILMFRFGGSVIAGPTTADHPDYRFSEVFLTGGADAHLAYLLLQGLNQTLILEGIPQVATC